RIRRTGGDPGVLASTRPPTLPELDVFGCVQRLHAASVAGQNRWHKRLRFVLVEFLAVWNGTRPDGVAPKTPRSRPDPLAGDAGPLVAAAGLGRRLARRGLACLGHRL